MTKKNKRKTYADGFAEGKEFVRKEMLERLNLHSLRFDIVDGNPTQLVNMKAFLASVDKL